MRRAARTPVWAPALLALLCAGAVVTAVLVVGPRSTKAASSRSVTVQRGVVQSTVSGSGTIEAKQTNVDFAQSGQLQEVDVHEGEHVAEGQVLAKQVPGDQELSLEQAQANLRSAQAKLTQAEAQASASTSTSSQSQSASASAAAGPTGPTGSQGQGQSQDQNQSQSQNQSQGQTNSAATQASNQANIASAQAGVDSAEAAVQSAEQAVSDTTLTAPVSGTIASLSAGVGDFVSGGGSSQASSSSSSSSSSAGGGGNGGSGGNGGASNPSSSSSSSSGSSFIVIVDMSRLDLVVPFSESDIHKLKLHQPATVTVNALPGTQLAAHVTSIDTLPTTNNSVVSYNVTFRLDQTAKGLKPGMTGSAAVVVKRVDDAVNVSSAAITGSGQAASATVVQNGKAVRRQVSTGIVGDSTTQVITGLQPGDEVEVPIATGSATSGSSSPFGNRTGGGGALGGGLGGGGGFFPGAGGGARIRAGGGGGP